MKTVKTIFQTVCLLCSFSVVVSCGGDDDDDNDNDCGYSAIIQSNENFEAAVAAYSSDSSDANCEAVTNAITDFNDKAQRVDVECLNENDATNFLSWVINVETSAPC